MIKNYLISALRNILKYRTTSVLNILSLSIGIACCTMVFLIVSFETSFDDFHKNADRIYRVTLKKEKSSGTEYSSYNFYPLGREIKHNVSGIEEVTSIHVDKAYNYEINNTKYDDRFAFFVEPNYSTVFDVNWLVGSSKELNRPNSVVLSEKMAKKHFGGVDKALGQTIIYNDKLNLEVVGVVGDPPANTDHPYSMLISYISLEEYLNQDIIQSWDQVETGAVYVLLNKGIMPIDVRDQLSELKTKYFDKESVEKISFGLMALNKNHDSNENYTSINYDFPKFVMVLLSFLALSILVVSCFNNINLTTAIFSQRTKEVGVRKTFGASKRQLIFQYLSETLIITLIAVLIGSLAAYFGLMHLSEIFNVNGLHPSLMNQPALLVYDIIIVVILTVIAGFYPAFVLSSSKTIKSLKQSDNYAKAKWFSMRKVLVIGQFSLSIMLILITFTVMSQLDSYKQRPMGFNVDGLLFVSFDNRKDNKIKEFQDLSLKSADIENVTLTSVLNHIKIQDPKDEDMNFDVAIRYVDEHYLETFDIELLAGSDLSNTTSEVIINKSLSEKLQFESPQNALSNFIKIGGENFKIIGVIKDYEVAGNGVKNTPHVLSYDDSFFNIANVKINTNKYNESIDYLETCWLKINFEDEFSYVILKDFLNKRFGIFEFIIKFFEIVSLLAILMGTVGIYGLVSFMANRMKKQISVRKVFGASINIIIMTFLKRFTKIVLVSFILAAPLSYLVSDLILMEFPERQIVNINVYLFTFLGAILLTISTIGRKVYSAAKTDPVKNLRYE